MMRRLAICLLASACVAETDVGGLILQDQTWHATGSPYRVTSSIIVGDRATLSIEPGVEVIVEDDRQIVIGSEFFGSATLRARGTASTPIHFFASTPEPGAWHGIRFNANATDATYVDGVYDSGSILEHVTIRFGGGGASDDNIMRACITCDGAAPHLSHVLVRDSSRNGIVVREAPGEPEFDLVFEQIAVIDCAETGVDIGVCALARIDGLYLMRNEAGLDLGSAWQARITGGEVRDCSDRGMSVSTRFEGEISDLVLTGNTEAMTTRNSRVTVERCVFEGNTDTALRVSSRDSIVRDCLFIDNSTTHQGGAITVSDIRNRITMCEFRSNQGGDGGAIHVTDRGGQLDVHASIFEGNVAERGGAMFIGDSIVTTTACRFEANVAESGGGAFVNTSLISFAGDPGVGPVNHFTGNVAHDGRGPDLHQNWYVGDVDARFVCWDTLDPAEIEARIWHATDDPTLGAILTDDPVTCDTCIADIDGDGDTTIFDVIRFTLLFSKSDPRADFDGDGAFTIFDFIGFLHAFDGGCP